MKNFKHNFEKILLNLNQEKTAYGLIIFRILFGAILCYEAVDFYFYKIPFYNPKFFHFPYILFTFIKCPPIWLSKILIILSAVLSFMVAVGLMFRLALLLHMLIFTYYFFIEQAFYLNHHYAVILLEFSLLFTNAHAKFSFDSLIKKNPITFHWLEI